MLAIIRSIVTLSCLLALGLAAHTGVVSADDPSPLRYAWKKGEHYLYSVRIEVKSDGSPVVLTSLNNYGVVSADDKAFGRRQRNNLLAEKEDAEGKRTPVILQSGLTAAALRACSQPVTPGAGPRPPTRPCRWRRRRGAYRSCRSSRAREAGPTWR